MKTTIGTKHVCAYEGGCNAYVFPVEGIVIELVEDKWYCSQHKPVTPIAPVVVAVPETKEAFDAAMVNPGFTLSLDNPLAGNGVCKAKGCKEYALNTVHQVCRVHATTSVHGPAHTVTLPEGMILMNAGYLVPSAYILDKDQAHGEALILNTPATPVVETKTEKVEMTMENVKNKAAEVKEQATKAIAEVKEKGFFKSLGEFGTTAWSYVKKGYKAVKGLVKDQAANIGITVGAVLVAGAATSSAMVAVPVGAGIALAIIACKTLIQKKKKEAETKAKDLLVTSAVVLGTAILLPFALYGAAYVGIFATAFGAVLPYAIIVA